MNWVATRDWSGSSVEERENTPHRGHRHKQSQEAGNSMEHDPTSHAALLRWELTARAWGAMRIERNRGSSRTVRTSSVRGVD